MENQEPKQDFEERQMPPMPELQPIPLWLDLLGLFLHPGLTFVHLQMIRRWKMPLLILVLLLGFGALYHTHDYIREVKTNAEVILRDFSRQALPMTFQDGKIHWRKEVPERLHYGNLEIQFCGDEMGAAECGSLAENDADKASGVDFLLQIFPNRVCLKTRDGNMDKIRPVLVSPEQMKGFAVAYPEGIDESRLFSFHHLALMILYPIIWCGIFLWFSWPLLFFGLIFLVSSLLFQRRGWRSLGTLLILAINFALVPVLVTLIWYTVNPFQWEYESILCGAFVLYLLYVYRDRRALLQSMQKFGEIYIVGQRKFDVPGGHPEQTEEEEGEADLPENAQTDGEGTDGEGTDGEETDGEETDWGQTGEDERPRRDGSDSDEEK